jgi:hypothetical protein
MKKIPCKCGNLTTTGRCKSCSNKNRAGKYHQRQQKWNEESKAKIRGEKNSQWNGENATLPNIHRFIERRKPRPEKCVRCNEGSAIDLANISGEYTRNINDYEWLCRRCHMISDGRINNLKKGREALERIRNLKKEREVFCGIM